MHSIIEAACGEGLASVLKKLPSTPVYFGNQWEPLVADNLHYIGLDNIIGNCVPLVVKKADGSYAHADVPLEDMERFEEAYIKRTITDLNTRRITGGQN